MFSKKLQQARSIRSNGFTVIELIVVIALLTILISLVVPAFTGIRESAAEQVAESNARSVYTGAAAAITLNSGEPYQSFPPNKYQRSAPDHAFQEAIARISGIPEDEIYSVQLDAGGNIVQTQWKGTINGVPYLGNYDVRSGRVYGQRVAK